MKPVENCIPQLYAISYLHLHILKRSSTPSEKNLQRANEDIASAFDVWTYYDSSKKNLNAKCVANSQCNQETEHSDEGTADNGFSTSAVVSLKDEKALNIFGYVWISSIVHTCDVTIVWQRMTAHWVRSYNHNIVNLQNYRKLSFLQWIWNWCVCVAGPVLWVKLVWLLVYTIVHSILSFPDCKTAVQPIGF